ncbi:MAG: cation transporter [Clostridia bacterium]|nr:cation transporter [Clostridia bacterium]
MISILGRIFLKNKSKESAEGRRAWGALCSIAGIALNILLFLGKLLAGTFAGSIAITADAFNNLSDAGSSLITLIGFRFAGKKPDPEHPFGHGRFEYISGLLVSVIIIVVGVELMTSSISKIINPEPIGENWVLSAIILGASILVKLYMFFYNRTVGKQINSAGMKATAMDCISDSIATAVVLLSLVIGVYFDIMIDGWCGVLVSLFILFAGFKSAMETLKLLLGAPPEKEFVEAIEKTVLAHPVVIGIHDLIVHDYGPGRQILSLHAEVDGKGDIYELHDEIDLIEQEIAEVYGTLAVIHMDPVETDNEVTNSYRMSVAKIVKTLHEDVTIHDFRMVPGVTHTNLIFDAVVPHSVKADDNKLKKEICDLVSANLKNCNAVVQIDRPFIN